MTPSYHQIERQLIAWAGRRSDIRAVLVVGSRARTIQQPDEMADLDLVIFTLEIEQYRRGPLEIDHVAPVWLVVPSPVNPAHAEWLVLYAGGYKVDLYFAPISEHISLAETLPQLPFQGVMARGMRVLVDKTSSAPTWDEYGWSSGTINEIEPKTSGQDWEPDLEQFQTNVNVTLLSASRALKFIRRKDLWRAKFQVDTDLKRRLLTFVEWHAQSVAGRRIDTWYEGRFLADWASPNVLQALPYTFGAYQAGDLLRALQATLALFDQLARELSTRLGYRYPQDNHEAVLTWLVEQIEVARDEIG